jgi:hypothetical protein
MLVAPVFVVPAGTLLPKPELTNSAEPVTGANDFPRYLEVLSPPPRLSTTA